MNLKRFFEKTSTCDNNPEASYTTEMNKHEAFALYIFVKSKIFLKINKIFIEDLICNPV